MSDPTPNPDPTDAPVDDDEMLVQRYCDGTLSEARADAVEARMERDPAFAQRMEGTASLFAMLDLAAGALPDRDFASAAVSEWRQPRSWVEFFGGLAPAVAGFLVLDALLGGLLAGLMVVRGPAAILRSWLVGLKDLVVWADAAAPTADQAVLAVSLCLVLGTVLLGGVGLVLRGVLARAGARTGVKR